VDRGQRKRGTKGGIGRERGVNVVNEDGKGGGGGYRAHKDFMSRQ